MITHKDHSEPFISQAQLIITQVYLKCFPQRQNTLDCEDLVVLTWTDLAKTVLRERCC